MCIISNLPKGTKKDTQEVYDFIRSGYNCNGQGSGYMFKRDGEKKITVEKGFFNCDALIDSIKSKKLGDNDELSVHHRIGTGGDVNGPNSHPFVISHESSEVAATSITTTKPCLVHNGIFRNLDFFELMNPKFSDTYAFARYVMTEPDLMDLYIYDQNAFEKKLTKILGWSKITIMFPDRDMINYGTFIEDNGYNHSNGGYKTRVYDRGGSSTCDVERRIPFLLEAPKAKEKSTAVQDVKSKIVKVDSSYVKLTSKNYNHFLITKKDTFDDATAGIVFYELTGFDENAIMNVVRRREGTDFHGDPFYRSLSLLTNKILTEYYFVPKTGYVNIYKDLRLLINSKVSDKVGNTTVKLLKNILDSNHKKEDNDKIFYKRFRTEFCKLSLSLFRDHLVKILNDKAKKIADRKEESFPRKQNDLMESEAVTS